MYETHRPMVIHSYAKYGRTMSKDKKDVACTVHTWQCPIPYKFDLEVKGQCHIGIMNVCNISPHGDTPIGQLWQANVKANRS